MNNGEASLVVSYTVQVDLQVALDESEALRPQLPTLCQFQAWVSEVLKYTKVNGAAEVSIRVVDKDEMTDLNQTYRHKSGTTNVLSFPYSCPDGVNIALLGDIAICLPVIVEESSNQMKKFIDHWAHMVLHGMLHLLGYDHISAVQAEEMEKLEIEILAAFNITDPYGEIENK
jgi:probable rRNA maturation factor